MNALESSPLAPVYTCHICRRSFSLNGPPIIGEKKEQRLGKVAQTLVKHLQTEHKEIVMQLAMLGNQIQGWIFMDQFDMTDADLLQEGEMVRRQLRAITKRVHISDEMIARQVDAHFQFDTNTDEDPRGIVITLLKTMRDRLDEVQPLTAKLQDVISPTP